MRAIRRSGHACGRSALGPRIAGALGAAVAVLSGPAVGPAQADPVHGFWLTENQRAIVEIRPCGATVCGRLAWMAEPNDADGKPKTDVADNTLCGLELIGSFMQSRPGSWSDGYIYNPRDGGRYSAWLEVKDRDRLEVHGYVGLSLFGKSQIWTRLADSRGGC